MNPIEIVFMIVSMIWSFAANLICCNYGEYLVHRFDMVEQELYKSDWYLFPLEMQRMLIVVIPNLQHPTVIRGYGNVTCTRQTSKTVHLFDLDAEKIFALSVFSFVH